MKIPLNSTSAQKIAVHDFGGLNVDGCRIETSDNLKRTQHARGIWSQEKHTHTRNIHYYKSNNFGFKLTYL